MAANREERFLMRQRGAGTARDLRDSGFALAIPGGSDTPAQARPSPQTRSTGSRSQAATPTDGGVAGGQSGGSSGKRKRKSIGQASESAKRRRSAAAEPEAPPQVEEEHEEQEEKEPQDDDQEDELESPPVAQRRASAKAKGKQPLRPTQGRSAPPSDSEDALAGPSTKPSKPTARRPRTSLPALAEEPSASDQENPPARRRTTKRRRQPSPAAAPSPPAKKARRSSAQAKPARRRAPQRRSSPDLAAPAAHKPGTIPVTVQRLRGARALDFVPAADELAGPAPLLKRPGVNAVDVLAQVCREIVAKAAAALAEPARRESGAARAGLKRRGAAVLALGNEMEARFLQMTSALDHHRGLAQHGRALARAKAAALAELLEVREARAALALRADAVRASHDADARAARHDAALYQVLADARMAAGRGREAQRQGDGGEEVGLELRVRNAADRVSSAAGRVGLLERVRRFNRFLEGAATALE